MRLRCALRPPPRATLVPGLYIEGARWDSGSGALEESFMKEAALGMMYKVPLEEARRQFPGASLRIAAQGAIEKGDNSFRIVHAASHGVQVNHGIKP